MKCGALLLSAFLLNPLAVWAGGQAQCRLTSPEIKRLAGRVPVLYQKEVAAALKKSGRNGCGLARVIEDAQGIQIEGAAFLIANMPDKDLASLDEHYIKENNALAYEVLNEVAWGQSIPTEIFLNYVLPYASVNERRDRWRKDFHDRFIGIAKSSGSIKEAALKLNKHVFKELDVSYNPDKRPKADQSPYESTEAKYASCTGLSVLLIDALRSVGIPARLTGTAMWPDNSGNHTWVEIWDGEWHYVGASESTAFDDAWFTAKAAQADQSHPIYAVSFERTSQHFPMRWAQRNRTVPAIDVTDRYKK